MGLKPWAVDGAAIVALLALVAATGPLPWFPTDRDVYEAAAARIIVPDCSDIHCFRPLVPWMLGRIPGPTMAVWKGYAVLATAAAAIGVGVFCTGLGMTVRAARFAVWLVALGFGPMLTLFNPHTPDPLMFALGPIVSAQIVAGRRARATIVSAIGVFAKEVAAAPLWIGFLWCALRRRWNEATQWFAIAFGVTLLWAGLQLWLMLVHNYSYAGSASADLLHGGYIVKWAGELGAARAAATFLGSFGAVFLLAPAGFVRASRELRLFAIASIPAMLVLMYVEQPDRAVWNYHYVLIPLAVLALQDLNDALCWLFVASYGLANLRVGAQVTYVPSARYGLLVSMLIGGLAIVKGVRGA